MQALSPTIGFKQPLGQANQPNAKAADDYNRGMTLLKSSDRYDRELAIVYLKDAADQGHEGASEALRSLCDDFARTKIDSNSDRATWNEFKELLFVAYPPWERVAFLLVQPSLPGTPHLLQLIPQRLREAIYSANWEATNQGNQATQAEAWFECAQLQSKGFGVQQSYIEAYKSLCWAQQLGHPAVTTELINQTIEQIEMELRILLKPTSDGPSKETVLQDGDFASGVQCLKMAANSGNQRAKQALKSFCNEFSKGGIDSTNKTVWSKFIYLLSSTYTPWQRLAFLHIHQHVLNTMPQGLRENIYHSVISAQDQLALIDHIRSKKESLKLTDTEKLTITYADMADAVREQIKEIEPVIEPVSDKPKSELSIDVKVIVELLEKALSLCNEKRLKIVIEQPPLKKDDWMAIWTVVGMKDQNPAALSSRGLAQFYATYSQSVLKNWVVVPIGTLIRTIFNKSWVYVNRRFIPDSVETLVQDLTLPKLLSIKDKNEQLSVLKSFFHSAIPRHDPGEAVTCMQELIENSWFNDKVQKKLIKFDDVLLFTSRAMFSLLKPDVQKFLDDNPGLISQINRFSDSCWFFLVSKEAGVRKFRYDERFPNERFFRLTRAGLSLVETDGIYEFLSSNQKYFDAFVTVNMGDEDAYWNERLKIESVLSHPVILDALNKDALDLDKLLRNRNLVTLLCEESVQAGLARHPEWLFDLMKLDKAIVTMIVQLEHKSVRSMVASGMVVDVRQLLEIQVLSRDEVKMDAQIILNAVDNNTLPTDVQIAFVNLKFPYFPADGLVLPANISLTSCSSADGKPIYISLTSGTSTDDELIYSNKLDKNERIWYAAR